MRSISSRPPIAGITRSVTTIFTFTSSRDKIASAFVPLFAVKIV